MPRSLKLTLCAVAALLAAAALTAVIMLLSWRAHAKPQVEAAASDALGMQVSIGGALALKFFPSVAMTLNDVHIRSHDTEFASVGQATLDIQLVSLLRRQVRIPNLRLQHVSISVERDRAGKLNVGGSSPGATVLPDLPPTDVSMTDTTFVYTNHQEGSGVHAGPCNVQASDLQVTAAKGADLMQALSLSAKITCEQVKTKDLPMSDVRFSVRSAGGVLTTDDLTMHAFGGQGSAAVRADYSGKVPAYRVHGVLSKFRLEEFSRNFSQKKIGEGLMDFTTQLTMSGANVDEMTRTSSGAASLRGTNLILDVGNLDEELSHYKATQRFTLVDLGAFFLAGPIGLAVTKGIDYSKVISAEGGTSQVKVFISEWQVERGVAEAKDVAMATAANRVALKGNLDFVNQSFQDVTVAVVGKQGCVVVQQKVHGSFSHPDVDKPNVVVSLAGPALHLLKKASRALGSHCDVFYAGSLPPVQ
jgi:AsmA family/AsmA-like C-terminal region